VFAPSLLVLLLPRESAWTDLVEEAAVYLLFVLLPWVVHFVLLVAVQVAAVIGVVHVVLEVHLAAYDFEDDMVHVDSLGQEAVGSHTEACQDLQGHRDRHKEAYQDTH
jgi:hypothetical protein